MEFLSPPTTPQRVSNKSSRRSILPTSCNSPLDSSRSGQTFSSTFPSFDTPSGKDAGMTTPTKTSSYDNSKSLFATPNNNAAPNMNSSISITGSTITPSSFSCDRFIPNRSSMDFDYCDFVLQDENLTNSSTSISSVGDMHDNSSLSSSQLRLKKEILQEHGTPSGTRKRLMNCFNKKEEIYNQEPSSIFGTSSSSYELMQSPKKKKRTLPTGPSRVLDAPELMDDYYLNLLDWGHNNVIAIALKRSVYLWNASNSEITQLVTLPDESDYVSSLQWNKKDNTIALGTFNNVVQIWDTTTLAKTHELSGHSSRISSLSWSSHHTLSSGGRDSKILNYDIRQARNAVTHTYLGHAQEICGLAWSEDGTTLASGGNENLLCIWDASMSGGNRSSMSSTYEPRLKLTQHQAAVKALAWCPWQRNTLASGGGTADRTIRIWNTISGTNTKSVDTNSQVCALQWNEPNKELVSSHGFSDNQLILWNYPNMQKLKEFRGHSARVLHMAQSPDNTTIVSASADETLRFWDIFGTGPTGGAGKSGGPGSSSEYSMSHASPCPVKQSLALNRGASSISSLTLR